MALVRVAVPIPLAHEDTLVYEFPEETPEVGLRVLVPVGPRRVWGTVLGVEPKAPGFRVRKIAGIPEPRLVVTPELLELCRWVSDYYAANLSDVLQAAVPSPGGLTRRAPRAAPEDADAWLQVARGTVEVNGQTLNAGDGAAIEDERTITLRGRDAEVLLFDLN